MSLRQICPKDFSLLRDIYTDAIESQGDSLYSLEQVQAWSGLAWLPGVLDCILTNGTGWISGEREAFAIRYPTNCLAMLYCRGRSSRKGHASALMDQIEAEALTESLPSISTFASQFSLRLLRRRGWKMISIEPFLIGGVQFEHYRMVRLFRQLIN